jgi:hypothetical protein
MKLLLTQTTSYEKLTHADIAIVYYKLGWTQLWTNRWVACNN